jgi:Methyltransferase domain
MFSEMIETARQRTQQRIDEAFTTFSGGEEAYTGKNAHRRLKINASNTQPVQENIKLPFDDEAVDWVACYDLLENFLSFERQVRLLRELLRISKKGVFVSTPNRWHPLSGWLRPQPHAGLVDAMKIKTMVDVLPGHPPWRLGHVRVMGLKSHYFLMIWKDERYVPTPVADQTGVVEPPAGRNAPGNETKEVIQGSP